MTISEAKEFKVAAVMCLDDVLFHSQYFYRKMFKRKFLVNHHHELVCKILNMVLEGLLTKVIINIAPRYSKTELAVKNFISSGFSHNPAAQFIHLSYSDTLVQSNSDAIKAIIKTPEYQAMFPKVRISNKNDSKKKWNTTEGGVFYAASTAGQVTGHGAGLVEEEEDWLEFDKQLQGLLQSLSINEFEQKAKFGGALVIDDPIKPEDAFSDQLRKKINDRWDSTIKNRVNSMRTPMIVMGQRTHEEDLSGYLMQQDGFTHDIEEAIKNPDIWFVLAVPVIQTDANGEEYSLWPNKHTLAQLKHMQAKDQLNFDTQYMQDPTPAVGLMYSTMRTYTHIPATETSLRKAYVDTADEGSDYLCSIPYIETEDAMYVLDIIYTKKPMEATEPMTAEQMTMHKVNICRVESNNGGRGFARAVERQARLLKNQATQFLWFHQSDNKKVRINSKSAEVTNMIRMPEGWDKLYPEAYKSFTKYRKEGKNPNDDLEDVLTGMCEFFGADVATSSSDELSAMI